MQANQQAISRTAWIYVRESDDEQLAGHSPETQERLCRELAEREHLTVTRIIWESGSARSIRQRKGWQETHKAIKRHEMDVLLVWKYSRLHRNFFNQVRTLADAKQSGVDILSAVEPIDASSKYGKAMLAFIGIFNELDSDNIREQSMAGMKTRALKGMPLVGKKPPYGYEWVTAQSVSTLTGAGRMRKVALTPHPVEADRWRAVWRYLDSPERTLGDCVLWLNHQMCWPSPQGKLWRKTTLRYLLQQPYYWGEGAAFRTVLQEVPAVIDSATGEVEMVKRARMRPVDERIKLPVESVPPLIERDTAMRVLGYIQARAKHRASKRLIDRERYLLNGGYLRCGVCGGSLSPRRRNGREDFYVCHGGAAHPKGDSRRHYLSIRARDVEVFAVQKTYELLVAPGEAEAALDRLGEVQGDQSSEIATAEAELLTCDRALENHRKLATILAPDDMADFALQYEALKRQRADWQARLDTLRASSSFVASLRASLAEATHRARALAKECAAARDSQGAAQSGLPSWLTPDEIRRRLQPLLQQGYHLAPWNGQPIFTAEGAQALEAFTTAPKSEQRSILQALGVYVEVRAGEQREGEKRLTYRLPCFDADGPDKVSFRSGRWPVAVSASHASSTPMISCSA